MGLTLPPDLANASYRLCQFRFIFAKAQHKMWHESLELRGVEKLVVTSGKIDVRLGSYKDNFPTGQTPRCFRKDERAD